MLRPATNLCIWLATLVLETQHALHYGEPGPAAPLTSAAHLPPRRDFVAVQPDTNSLGELNAAILWDKQMPSNRMFLLRYSDK